MSEILVLDWLPDQIRGLVGPSGGRGTTRASGRMDSPDHADSKVPAAQAGEALRAWLQQEGLVADQVIVVLPRDASVIRRLQVPQAPPDELPELVRFQAATRTSAPIDSLVIDFLPLPVFTPDQGQDVICFSMSLEMIGRIEAVCQAAKLQIQKITLAPLTVGELLRSTIASGLGLERPELVVYQQGDHVELSIFDFGTLIFGHSVRLGSGEDVSPEDRIKPLKSDLARSMITFGQTYPDAELTQCYYVSGVNDQDVRQFLEARFPGGVRPLDTNLLPLTGAPPGSEALVGALQSSRDDRLHIDFLHPRKKREVPDRRKWYIGAAAVLGVLAAGVAYSVYYSKSSALEESIQALQKDVDSKRDLLTKGKPKADAFARVNRWKESQSDPLELWNQLRALLVGTERIYFKDMKVTPLAGEMQAKFVGNGNARTSADVYGLYQTLSDNGFRVSPTTPTQDSSDPDYPWKFSLTIEMLRPREMPAAAAVATNSPTSLPSK